MAILNQLKRAKCSKCIFRLITSLTLLFLLISCDTSLHNTAASFLIFELEHMPNMVSGTFVISGTFATDSWSNSTRTFEMVNGKGEYDGSLDTFITESELSFTIVPEGSWDRPWAPATLGNDATSMPAYEGFSIVVPVDGEIHTITIDGSTSTATIKIDDDIYE